MVSTSIIYLIYNSEFQYKSQLSYMRISMELLKWVGTVFKVLMFITLTDLSTHETITDFFCE